MAAVDLAGQAMAEIAGKQWTSTDRAFEDTMAVIREAPLLIAPGTRYNYKQSGILRPWRRDRKDLRTSFQD